MKALRRSLKGEKNEVKVHPHHASITPKDATAILPPKKVIRALYDYEANPNHEQELSFAKGDFFHVIGRENDRDWYEACNPSMPNARGLVPVQFFQVLGRTERDSAGSTLSRASTKFVDSDSSETDRSRGGGGGHPNGHAQITSNPNPTVMTPNPARSSTSLHKGTGAMVYGIVIYDFAAERPDELEAKAGEAIIVIAQSNPEWFVAKPIGRLGGPGLIPVSFIEIRDMTTGQPVKDPHEAVQRAGVPKVEEWKKMAADYKNSSITLGKFESGNSQRMTQEMERMSLNGGRQSYPNGYPNGQPRASHQRGMSGTVLPEQNPYSRPTSSQLLAPMSASIPRLYFARDKYWYVIDAVMEDGRHWELSRAYQDFYDFQIALLSEFPDEAGNAGKPRTLPYMPGPVTYVTEQISNMRRESLDEYIKKLLTMSSYISRCHLIRQLFAPREGDYPVDADAQTDTTSYGRLSEGSQPSSMGSGEDASRQSSRGNLNGGAYAPGLSAPPPRSAPQHRQQPSYSTNGVAQAVHYRSPSDQVQQQHQPPPQSQLQPQQSQTPRPGMTRQVSNLTQGSNGSGATASTANPAAAAGGGAGGGAMKIKVYFQDDLIAIRVPTDISFEQLKEKLQGRLSVGDGIQIQYRDEPSNSYEALQSDEDLYVALQRNPKLTLYVN